MTIVDFSTGVDRKIAEPLWQWDYGQILRITGLGSLQIAQVHFCDRSCTDAIVRVGNLINDGLEAAIPDKLLENEWDINAFVYLCKGSYVEDTTVSSTTEGTYYTRSGTESSYVYTAVTLPTEYSADATYYKLVLSGKTIKYVQIPVIKRKKPEDYIDPMPDDDRTLLEQMIASVNATLLEIKALYDSTITVEELKEMVTEEVTKQIGIVSGEVDTLQGDVADIQDDIQSLTTRVSNLEFNVNTYMLKYPSSLIANTTSITLHWDQDDPTQQQALVKITPSPADNTNYTLGVQKISGVSEIIATVLSKTGVKFELLGASERDSNVYRIYTVERPSVYVEVTVTVG